MSRFADLPRVALFDASVLVQTRGREEEPLTRLTRDLWDELLDGGSEILIPAPALGEYLRRPPQTMPPRLAGVEVVAFDEICAQLMAQNFPASSFKEERLASGLSMPYLKFDAMILSMAIRYAVTCVVSMDRRQRNLGTAVAVDTRHPEDFIRQFGLDL